MGVEHGDVRVSVYIGQFKKEVAYLLDVNMEVMPAVTKIHDH